jgi:hypothetical protein
LQADYPAIAHEHRSTRGALEAGDKTQKGCLATSGPSELEHESGLLGEVSELLNRHTFLQLLFSRQLGLQVQPENLCI